MQVEPQVALPKILFARYYGANLGRFLSVDPLEASARLRMPQSWNRYGYVLNNPLVMTDPTGLKDNRTDKDKEILEDSDVKETAQQAWDESNPEGNPDDRQEVGFIVVEGEGGDLETTETVTQGHPLHVDLPAVGAETKVVMEGDQAGKTAVADVHTQPGANTTPMDPDTGQRVQRAIPPGISPGDRAAADARGIPTYAIGKKKMYAYDPATDKKPRVVLSGKHFKAYMGKNQ